MKRGALPTGIVSTTRLVCGSTRVTVLLSVLVTQTASSPTAMVATTVLALGSRRATVFFGALEIHTSSSTAIQSGLPGTGKTASGVSRSIGILTPGDLTPGLVACVG